MAAPILRALRRALLLPLVFTCALHAAPGSSPSSASAFAAPLDALNPADPAVADILERARDLTRKPLLKRARSIADMGEHASHRSADTRSKADSVRARLGPENAERFALASGDMGASRLALDELPLLAAAWRLTGDTVFRDHLDRQLREVVTWRPFQRPGWSLPHRKDPLPPEGDGVWLATGTLIQALALTLDILPPDSLPPDLVAAVRTRLGEEVNLTLHDWRAGIPWYVNGDKANSNQWVVPASGLVIGATVLGRDRFADAWQLGVDSLRKSLALAGSDGSLNEGYTYGRSWTSFSLLLTARITETHGDPAFANEPFFQNFASWLALSFQPGGNPVNAFDGFDAQRGSVRLALTDLTRAAALSGNASLVRLVKTEADGLRGDFFGLLAHGILNRTPDAPPLPTAGNFQRSRLFAWRGSWAPDASGIWIRGGDADDFHDHHDRGHVNFIVRGTPVLIEAGTPGYSHPRKRTDYDSARGHNTLVLDGNAFPLKAPAEIEVHRHDSQGGSATVDLRQAYPALSKAIRTVSWTTTSLTTRDEISAKEKPVSPAWRWHLASAAPPTITQIAPDHWRVHVPAGNITFHPWVGPWTDPDQPKPTAPDELATLSVDFEIRANHPITVEASSQTDHTLKFRRPENPHTVLVVSTPAPVSTLAVDTTLQVAPPPPASPLVLLQIAAANPAVADARQQLINRARAELAHGILRRPTSLDQLTGHRIKPSTSAARMTDPVLRERFSLASFDSNAGSNLAAGLPLVAAAGVLTGEPAFHDHVRAQLAELTTWRPLQRPGWSLAANPRELPPEGDGPWLATGWIIRAIADTLEFCPPGVIDENLREQLDALLDSEIGRIAADWRNETPWYVQRGLANSNQWVVPAEGLVRACLLRGIDRHRADYELGIAALLRSLDAQGSAGEFTEGLTYASITVKGLISAARASARAGDNRLESHPFLRHTGTWFAHHIQPGGFLVNAFDTLNGARGQLSIFGNVFAELAVGTGNPHALWALRHHNLSGNTLDYLLATALPKEAAEAPPLFAFYPVGTRTVWRSSWSSDASGVWIRGGGASDFHDHADRGHVNAIIAGRPVLVEAGTPPYGTPEAARLYTGLAGHNVLQVGLSSNGSSANRRRVAPIEVHRLDAAGGHVTVDATSCHPEASLWRREITWDADHVRIHDKVVLHKPDVILFRWHLAEPADASRDLQPARSRIGDIEITHTADQSLETAVETMPDATLRARTLGTHACLVVRTAEPVQRLETTTIVRLAAHREQ